MKILAVQASSRPEKSNTEKLLKEFLGGAAAQGAETETVNLKEKNISFCQACYRCWMKTPGVCAIKDDMATLLEKVKECDVLVYATPLYYYDMSARLRVFLERLLPLSCPHFVKVGDTYRHPQRFPVHRKIIIISTCGFPDISHFDAMRDVFRRMAAAVGTPIIGELLVPAGELLKYEALKPKTEAVLLAAYQAGIEVVRDGKVSPETEEAIRAPLISADEQAALANSRLERLSIQAD